MSMKQRFFKLLKYSNELKKDNKYLSKEDLEAFDTLLHFMVIIEGKFNYLEKHEYINLTKDFLNNEITADDFSYSFQAIYEGITEKVRQMEREEPLELANFLSETKTDEEYELENLLLAIYDACDDFSPDPDV